MIDFKNLIAVEEATDGAPVDTVVESTPTDTQNVNVNTVEPEATAIDKYSIDGEEFSIDEIREWKRGNMRQSDYTRKTQEIAKQRKEAEEALEVYNYLMSNQELVQKLVEIDTENPIEANKAKEKLDPLKKELEDVKTQLKIKDIDNEIKEITSKDKLVSDIELLQIATEKNCDINTAYKLWRADNMDKILAEKEREITEKIKRNAEVTKTLITPTDKTPEVQTYGLSEMEIVMAERLGMTIEEYATYKNPNYKMK